MLSIAAMEFKHVTLWVDFLFFVLFAVKLLIFDKSRQKKTDAIYKHNLCTHMLHTHTHASSHPHLHPPHPHQQYAKYEWTIHIVWYGISRSHRQRQRYYIQTHRNRYVWMKIKWWMVDDLCMYSHFTFSFFVLLVHLFCCFVLFVVLSKFLCLLGSCK